MIRLGYPSGTGVSDLFSWLHYLRTLSLQPTHWPSSAPLTIVYLPWLNWYVGDLFTHTMWHLYLTGGEYICYYCGTYRCGVKACRDQFVLWCFQFDLYGLLRSSPITFLIDWICLNDVSTSYDWCRIKGLGYWWLWCCWMQCCALLSLLNWWLKCV